MASDPREIIDENEEFLDDGEIENEVTLEDDEFMEAEDDMNDNMEAEDFDQDMDQGGESGQQVVFEDESIQGFFEHKGIIQ
ncbi:hypothetical protein AYI70_g11293 [Smittium culicis]|uniref:Uncharacterized protein n=1 Tax=Smittium culicis TaxID=133412 RepID=A0A1R1X2J2_9FUNG|nr:hypothetical protein AYI70_g11293 [Smittium culicis]